MKNCSNCLKSTNKKFFCKKCEGSLLHLMERDISKVCEIAKLVYIGRTSNIAKRMRMHKVRKGVKYYYILARSDKWNEADYLEQRAIAILEKYAKKSNIENGGQGKHSCGKQYIYICWR